MCYNVLVHFFVRCQSFSPSVGCKHPGGGGSTAIYGLNRYVPL